MVGRIFWIFQIFFLCRSGFLGRKIRKSEIFGQKNTSYFSGIFFFVGLEKIAENSAIFWGKFSPKFGENLEANFSAWKIFYENFSSSAEKLGLIMFNLGLGPRQPRLARALGRPKLNMMRTNFQGLENSLREFSLVGPENWGLSSQVWQQALVLTSLGLLGPGRAWPNLLGESGIFAFGENCFENFRKRKFCKKFHKRNFLGHLSPTGSNEGPGQGLGWSFPDQIWSGKL